MGIPGKRYYKANPCRLGAIRVLIFLHREGRILDDRGSDCRSRHYELLTISAGSSNSQCRSRANNDAGASPVARSSPPSAGIGRRSLVLSLAAAWSRIARGDGTAGKLLPVCLWPLGLTSLRASRNYSEDAYLDISEKIASRWFLRSSRAEEMTSPLLGYGRRAASRVHVLASNATLISAPEAIW